MTTTMTLRVLLPSNEFACYTNVTKVVLETPEGAFGLLPHRQDCITALEPGILTYRIDNKQLEYLAVDEGLAVKSGLNVNVSVRNAHAGSNLQHLKQVVATEFVLLNEQEQEVRAVLARLESDFMRGFKSLKSR